MDKINLYWPVYKNLEKEVLELSYHIHFCDAQHEVFSVQIAELLIRCAVEIESISKALYQREGGNMNPVDESGNARYLNYDFDCLKLLDQNWKLSKKQIILAASSMYFEKEENRVYTPLKNAHKGDAIWQKAYQAVKHSRVDNLNKANIRALVRAMAALYLLNLYYRDDLFEIGTMFEAEKNFLSSLQSDLFSVKYKQLSSYPYNGNELDDFSDVTYIGIFTKASYDKMSDEFKKMTELIKERALEKIKQNPIAYINKSAWDIALNKTDNSDVDTIYITRGFGKEMSTAKLNAVLNKCQRLLPSNLDQNLR